MGEKLDKSVRKAQGFGKEFKDFISRGNVVDLAVAVIIGAAFGAIVTSLVNDILMPLIGAFSGGLDFTSLSAEVGDAKIAYGNFLQAILNFVIIAFSIFLVVRLLASLKKKAAPEPVKDSAAINWQKQQTELLAEIRDSLKK